MFWWLYKSPNRVENPSKPWPIILWLQGGPGASGVELGNFKEVGPLDSNLKPRNSTWLQVADLLFVDNPVGTGFSFVEDTNLLVKNDEEAAADLTRLLQNIFTRNKNLQKSPLYIVAESYGGKFAVTLALSALKAIEAGTLKLKVGGVALGDSWISPEDFVLSWGPLLKDMSLLDKKDFEIVDSMAQKIKQQIRDGLYINATYSWTELEEVIQQRSNYVDFYNFLSKDTESGSSSSVTASRVQLSKKIALQKYSKYLISQRSTPGGSDDEQRDLMNDIIRKKLKIIPDDIKFDQQSDYVFQAMQGDFMKARIKEVDELLAKGVNVTIYNGQLDLICATKGTEAWIEKLKWEGLQNFQSKDRIPLFCGKERVARGFTKSYKNLHFYWILGAGHFVPVDEPCITLKMMTAITQSPALLSN
ncbi:serine carboxypeptidase-like 51 isoform X2 [Hevea brasiliensis]|nr:serine carboxypeptidase-like 51 isoform X2 [Hevea brasiliensis]XP_021692101.2 serine carboxypeptidase-like 51 isoform X2 [Hevea brasiliensis]